MDWSWVASALVSPLAAGILGAVAGSWTSWRFQARHLWWEKKAEAYIAILGALSDVERYRQVDLDDAEYHMTHDVGEDEPTWYESRKHELSERWEQGRREVDQAVHLGDFLISAEAHRVLEDFVRPARKSNPDDWFGAADEACESVKRCILDVRKAAQHDLRHRLRWRSLWSSQL